ncbi:MAG: Deoxyribose-phosphate aldolase [uncultured Solirubrobacteraceae bacterium]|uniref:Deoxyribose-phosphate aldolase n=1 Tax=uncultured Solirubrobacteraceae bacterium TaxID=1162706 RepID=A0A6J4SBD5_9ACTN|nr:MAG: Deoxyribose-phosphate aldolase [uncultured Solirubrobacteraceae bacterium]
MTPADPARLVGLVDLTTLRPSDTAEAVGALCDRAVTPLGPVAAVCVLPRFVAQCADRLEGSGVRIATVANPDGDPDADFAARTTAAAVLEGADEVDVVAPWRAFLAGDEDALAELVAACAEECEHLKVVLETGAHPGDGVSRRMAEAAVGAGASFLASSTGEAGPGASPAATRLLLDVAAGRAGVKAAGGIRTAAEAREHVALADARQDGGATARTFRLGTASLEELLA